MKTCILCKKQFKPRHYNQKYCGSYKVKNTCAWKVSKLTSKMVNIKERVTNPNHKNYNRYSHLGIYESWVKSPVKFAYWAFSNGWNPGLQIDRKNNAVGYYPSNCRFITASENNRNKTNNVTDWVNRSRKCCKCNTIKAFKDFAVSRKEVAGIAYYCKLCKKKIDHIKYIKAKGL